MRLLDFCIIIIFISISKTTFASQWIEGNRLVIQGLDKITARIKTFEVDVAKTHKFGVLDIFVERCVFYKSIFIPEGFAHGFQALEKENYIIYSCTKYREKNSEVTIDISDKDLNIKWPAKKKIVSKKDKKGITFKKYKEVYL